MIETRLLVFVLVWFVLFGYSGMLNTASAAIPMVVTQKMMTLTLSILSIPQMMLAIAMMIAEAFAMPHARMIALSKVKVRPWLLGCAQGRAHHARAIHSHNKVKEGFVGRRRVDRSPRPLQYNRPRPRCRGADERKSDKDRASCM
jgi:hypothetical protein